MHADRLSELREELSRRSLDGFIIPSGDEHASEYVGSYAKRLAWLTGFTGSTGTAVVLAETAGLFVDSRYTLQARHEIDLDQWSIERVPQTSINAWLRTHASDGMRIGYDPWLQTVCGLQSVAAGLPQLGVECVAVESNPIDALWHGRPTPPAAQMVVHSDELSGRSSADKRAEIASGLRDRGIDAVVLTALDSIAWAFNVRGRDIPRTPVALAFAVVNSDATADLFVAAEKLTGNVIEHLGSEVRVHPRPELELFLRRLSGVRVAIDPDRCCVAISQILESAGAAVVLCVDPTSLPKARKNLVEIDGHRAAQLRDGVALTCFLHWLSVEVANGDLDELSAATKLLAFREATGALQDLSFDTISAAGPNSAQPHYRPTEASNRRLAPDSIYLVDSGGQYLDGTTDVTRTVAIGVPSEEMRDRFTRVLKGHIALARAIFPAGTRGAQLDILARQFLWQAGLDYGHGTGHGIGSYLCVHEGPHSIFNTAQRPDHANPPLEPGMLISNEPGFYKEGEYGIRIENLVLVVEHQVPGAASRMLALKTLTLAPIDRTLIEVSMLSAEERAWLDAYHVEVHNRIGPQLDGPARRWLGEVTRPLQ